MKILITAGGTTEKIDDVRGITNMGTGRLGALIADKFAALEDVSEIFYVCNARAVKPVSPKLRAVTADDTRALEFTVSELCRRHGFRAVIHSMAVSDYRTRSVTTPRALADLFEEYKNDSRDEIVNRISYAPNIASGGKIDSGSDELVVILEKTPKIISMLRGLAPEAVIVGFKLLSGVTEDVLIDAAHGLLRNNDCDYVLANDMRTIGEAAEHLGFLVDASRRYTTHTGKERIADAIVNAVMSSIKTCTS